MKNNNDPEWEIVDSLPSERKKQAKDKSIKKRPFYKSSKLWIGISVGLLLAFAFPPIAIIIRRLLSLWWLALLVFGYYSFKKQYLKK